MYKLDRCPKCNVLPELRHNGLAEWYECPNKCVIGGTDGDSEFNWNLNVEAYIEKYSAD